MNAHELDVDGVILQTIVVDSLDQFPERILIDAIIVYARAVKEINATESRARAAAPLRTELAQLVGRCGYDITNG